MGEYEPGGKLERRRKRDFVWRAARWLAVAGWAAMVAAVLLLAQAKPPTETFFDRYFGVPLRSWWDTSLTPYILYFMILGLAVSLAGLLFNFLRSRRRDDEFLVSLVLLAGFSVLGLILYLRYF
ncbi:hypothetical protein MJO47_05085 [Desulfuromonas sp. KJ2020]|uniref:hypothetical protein n=1 Tax=Desulfuromonas sp. KJ2020 TaxID=2919173 RepID=UPI0003209245|nr:hypothetical protein [Desulfuromonas sp. KJ2020]MCP3176469.1 hypothetical protein [Desulfuromonas sp. KJ2020]